MERAGVGSCVEGIEAIIRVPAAGGGPGPRRKAVRGGGKVGVRGTGAGQEQVALLDVRPQAELPRRDALLLRRPRDTVRHRRHESTPVRAGARDKGRVRDQKSANRAT